MITKFRAWFITNKVMIPPMTLTQAIHQQENQFSLVRLEDEFIFMMSTGLLDKNGVEIFEGDIVIAWSQGVKGTFEIKRRIDGLWLLYPAWKDGQFWYLSPTEDGRETVEVIGDIFRNSELLEVE